MKGFATALALVGILVAGGTPALSAEQTVKLGVKMFCPTCPFIVKRTLQKVDGVLDVAVSYAEQTAVVRFDDNKTAVAALTRATAGVGFPSELLATH